MSAAIRSLQVIASPRRGGAESTFARLTEALAQAGNPVVAALRRDSPLARMVAPAVERRELPMSNYLDLRSMLGIRRLARERECSVVQSWMSRATWLTRVPRGHVHVARIGGYYRLRYFRHAHGWVVNTRSLRDWMLREGFPAERVAWIGNFVSAGAAGLPLPFTRAQLGVPPEALLVVALGRLIPKKGFHDLIRAFTGLPERIDGRPLHLLLMGQGPQRAELEALAAPLAARMHFTGWIDNGMAALPLADVFVCPSREEAYGNVMMEAWSLGLPVVSTRSDGGLELVEDGDNGLLCKVADPADLQRALARVLGDAGLRASLAARGRELFLQRHDQNRVVAAYLDFYERLQRRYA